jgi:archaellum biogenesis ATPase FlaH
MKNFLILFLILSFFHGFPQGNNSSIYVNSEMIMVGEYHYFSNNDSIQLSIIKKIISESKFKVIDIVLEFPPELEYLISKNDTEGIKLYFLYNKDRHFDSSKLTKINQVHLSFIFQLLKIKSLHAAIHIKCIDTHYTIRPMYFCLDKIFSSYDLLPKHLNNQLHMLINQSNMMDKDLFLFDSIKVFFSNNKKQIRKLVSELDFYYLNKILTTPFFNSTSFISDYRERILHNNLKKLYEKENQIILILGNAHIRKNVSGNLYDKITKEPKRLFVKDLFTIGIVPFESFNSNQERMFDLLIINERGSVVLFD